MKKATGIFLTFLIITLSLPAEAVTGFAGGDGSKENPYRVATSAQLNEVRNNLDKCFLQIRDIYMLASTSEGGDYYNNATGWAGIGSEKAPFCGTYDGGGYNIVGIKGYALFAENSGVIKNLGMIDGTSSMSAITDVNNGTVENCINSNTITTSFGTMAKINKGEILNCKNLGSMRHVFASNRSDGNQLKSYCGGIAGLNTGVVKNCVNEGSIFVEIGAGSSATSQVPCAGGIVGYNGYYSDHFSSRKYGEVAGCVNKGDIYSETTYYATAYSGGIVAFGCKEKYLVTDCINKGNVSAVTWTNNSVACGIIAQGAAANCANMGQINSTSTNSGAYCAGIVSDGAAQNCYNTGSLFAYGKYHNAGAVSVYGTYSDCYWNIDSEQKVNGYSRTNAEKLSNAEGAICVSSKTTQEMKQKAFVTLLNAGSGANSKWKMDDKGINDGYPIFDTNPSSVIVTSVKNRYEEPLTPQNLTQTSELNIGVVNATEDVLPLKIAAVFYDGNGQICCIETLDTSVVAQNNDIYMPFEKTIPEDTQKLRIFVWNNSMMPLANEVWSIKR